MISPDPTGLHYGYKPILQFVRGSGSYSVSRILQSLFQVVFTIIYVLLLVMVYRFQIMVEYDYLGYVWSPNVFTIVTGLVLSGMLAAYLPVRLTRGGDIVLYALFAIAIVPSLIVPSLRSFIGTQVIIESQLMLSAFFGFLMVMCRLPVVNLAIKVFTQKSFAIFISVVAGAMMIPIVYYFGIPTSVPGLYQIYDVRLESRGAFAEMPTFIGYFWFWVARVFAPALLIMGLVRKSRFLVAYGVVISFYLFTLTALKSVAFSVALIFVLWILVRVFGRRLGSLVISGLVTIILLGAILYAFLGWFPITDLITRRTLIVPGALTDQYLRFYSEMDFSRWSYSFLSAFYENPHAGSPSGVVGAFFGRDTTTATAHIWADGYANFGYWGMAFVTLITGLLIWYLNSVTVGKSAYLVVPLAALIGYLLANTALTVALSTHGVALVILLLQFAPSEIGRDLPVDDQKPIASHEPIAT